MRRLTINNAIELAERYGGKFMSPEFVGALHRYRWRCLYGHEWEAMYSNVSMGTWCPVCANQSKYTIDDAIKLAESRGGKFLSDSFINVSTRYMWECSHGHQWEAEYNYVKNNGTWCPECGGTMANTINDAIQLAAEMGGKCLSTEYTGAGSHYLWECSHGHQWEAIYSNVKRGTWCPICALDKLRGPRRKVTIIDAKRIAESNGGECLSDIYINNKTKLSWRCKFGHEWRSSYQSVSRGSWCPECSNRKRKSLDEVRELAASRGGVCLSDTYDPASPMLWQCEFGHRWKASYSSISRGSWCPNCAGNKPHSLMEAKEYAIAHNGECLSKSYINEGKRLLWKCSEGHEWQATYRSVVLRGHWCPQCPGRRRESIHIRDLHMLAKTRGGECLSDEYIGYTNKYKWRCNKGHEWEANLNNVKRGSWCPICAINNRRNKV